MIRVKCSIAILFCALLCSCTPATGGDIPPVAGKVTTTETAVIIDCPVDFFGTWKVIDFLPKAFTVMGVLQSHKYQLIAHDVLGKEIEFQSNFYKFEDLIFSDIVYQVQAIAPHDYEEFELLHLLNQINQLNYSDEELIQYTVNDVASDTLYMVFVKGVEDEIWSEEYTEEKMLAITTTEFVIINSKYIYHTISGLLCERT
jgi:hypothetical protein